MQIEAAALHAPGLQGRGAQAVTLALGGQLRQLLRQQLLGLEALPGRVAVVFECGNGYIRRRVVQKL
ncbi:hypothetical protein D3C72_2397100 [compost metagenome]